MLNIVELDRVQEDTIREIAKKKLEKALANEKLIETELGTKIENRLHKAREVREDSIYIKCVKLDSIPE